MTEFSIGPYHLWADPSLLHRPSFALGGLRQNSGFPGCWRKKTTTFTYDA